MVQTIPQNVTQGRVPVFGADDTGLEESFGPQTSFSFVLVVEVSAVTVSEPGDEGSRVVRHYSQVIMG
jgi:hypothetical protein